jgi:hypothetical protein
VAVGLSAVSQRHFEPELPAHESVEHTWGSGFGLDGASTGAKDAWGVKWAREIG